LTEQVVSQPAGPKCPSDLGEEGLSVPFGHETLEGFVESGVTGVVLGPESELSPSSSRKIKGEGLDVAQSELGRGESHDDEVEQSSEGISDQDDALMGRGG
jgi:hypothetical protein